MHKIRELTESREDALLSPFAARASLSAGRIVEEEPDPVRTCYQRDRDRVLHSKAFRRLKRKTQVFIDPQGDHFRTRLTHTLEVAQVARTIGRALRLNEDLIEAIALAHDVGHPPFGHAGEQALDAALRETDPSLGFRHDEQSLRTVDVLEPLNLTRETRAGISGHSKGRADLSDRDGQPTSTLEAAVVRVSDRIAYLSHDMEDALRSGIVDAIPSRYTDLLGTTGSAQIKTMVMDVIVHSLDQPAIHFSEPVQTCMNELKEWMFEHVYLHYPRAFPDIDKAKAIVRDLFFHYLEPSRLPEGYEGVQGAVDYLAGMTDRFAMDLYLTLRVPRAFRRLESNLPADVAT